MSYLNTSMTKRADKGTALAAAILGMPSAIGVTAGGLAGYYGSDKTNNTPATVLGAIGGGIGTNAGAVAGLFSLGGLNDELNNTRERLKWLAKSDALVQELKNNPEKAIPANHLAITKDRIATKKQLAKTPKWIKYIAKHPKMHNALLLGGLGLSAAAGGTLGAKLGIMGGDALAS